MISLFLDTTNQYLFVGLQINKQLVDKIQVWNHQKHTEKAVSLIDEMLTSHQLSWFAIDKLYLSIGPGSYTGIRVGITIAKTMKALNDNLEVYTTNSLLLQTGDQDAISIIDAKSKQFYIAVYENLKPIVLPQVVSLENLLLIKKEWKKLKVIEDYHQVEIDSNFLDIKNLCHRVTNIDDLEPLYLKSLDLKKHQDK